MSAVASSIRVSAPVKAGKAAAFNRGARVASVSDPPLSSSAPCCHAYRYPIPRGSLTNVPRFAPRDAQVRPALPKARVSTVVRAREMGMKTDGTSATVRIPPTPHRKHRVPTTDGPIRSVLARQMQTLTEDHAFVSPSSRRKQGKKPNPQFATVDGKLWVCQGCGYIYDGSLGQWAENKRCPACGERRFALKTQAEMNIAIASLGITGLFILALYALVKLA